MNASPAANIKPPLSPYLVLLVAIVLPGMGQALNNTPLRGLLMVLFMVILGLITYQVADPQVSVIGHFAGGIFIYAISVMDAYYWAKVRSELFHRGG
jgi:hypothetical protein